VNIEEKEREYIRRKVYGREEKRTKGKRRVEKRWKRR